MAAKTPLFLPAKSSARSDGTQERTKRFLCALHTLVRSGRLYQKNHPRLLEDLEATAQALREALERVPAVGVRVEGRALWAAWAETRGGLENDLQAEIQDPRGELAALADELRACGIKTVLFEPETHIGELDTLARWLSEGTLRARSKPKRISGWAQLLSEGGVTGIKINEPLDRGTAKDETILASLVATVLAYSSEPTRPGEAASSEMQNRDQLTEVLRLLEKLARGSAEARGTPKNLARDFQAILAESKPEMTAYLVSVLSEHLPQENESPEGYLTRLADAVVLGFASREYRDGRLATPALRGFFVRLGEEHSLPLGNGLALNGPDSPAAAWSSEGYAEHLLARFWTELPGFTISVVLRGPDAWCVPVETIRAYLKSIPKNGQSESRALTNPQGSREEARRAVVRYARCLELGDDDARSTVAAGLAELADTVRELWPHPESSGQDGEFPRELIDLLCGALCREQSHRTAGLLAAALERVARAAFEARDYRAFERILGAVEGISKPPEARDQGAQIAKANAELAEDLAKRLVADDRWLEFVDAAVFGSRSGGKRKLSAQSEALPRLLRRDPARLADRLGLLLTTPGGNDALPTMAALLGEVGRPAIETLAKRLGDSRRHRVATAIRLLAATVPERLVEVLPKYLPKWDWGLQDLAISAVARPSRIETVAGTSEMFLATMNQAHPLVAPMMVDYVGLAVRSEDPELLEEATHTLMEIARGNESGGGSASEHKDFYLRIKAVEALGRMGAEDSVELLRELISRKDGLTHAEPPGLRAAAEEALELIEKHPASGRVREVQEGLPTANLAFSRPRRYLRVPLTSPLEARILRPEGHRQFAEAQTSAARVRTISLGGAFVESERKLAVGDSVRVEIRTGLRRIEGTAVVRNVTAGGNGIEFVHLGEADHGRLRRFVRRYYDK